MELATVRLDRLQSAVRNNEVSFPSQVPIFVRCAPTDLQTHAVQLYFVHGWSCQRIGERYGFVRNHIWQILNEWRRHAVSRGYIQETPPLHLAVPILANPLYRNPEPVAVPVQAVA
jgi:hypothetical protein